MLLVKDVLKPLDEVAFSSPFVKVCDIMKQMYEDNLRSRYYWNFNYKFREGLVLEWRKNPIRLV